MYTHKKVVQRARQHCQTSDSAAGAVQARAAVPAAATAAPQSLVRQEGHLRPAGQARPGSGSDSGGAVCCSGFCGSGQPRGAHAHEDRLGGFRGASSEGLQRQDWAAQAQVPTHFPVHVVLSGIGSLQLEAQQGETGPCGAKCRPCSSTLAPVLHLRCFNQGE